MTRSPFSIRLLERPGAWWVAASAMAWLLALVPDLSHYDFPRMVGGFVAVFILPGRLGQALLRRPSRGLLDDVANAAALSIALLAAFTVVWMEMHLSPAALGYVLLGLGSVGALAAMRRCPAPEGVEGTTSLPFVVASVGLAALTALFYAIGGSISLVPVGEEQLHVSILRKMYHQTHLDADNLMYQAHVASTYLYAPYHLGLTLLAHLARLDPITVFIKIRPCYMWLSLSALYGVLLALTRQRRAADWGLLVMVVLIFTNVGGQVIHQTGSWFYWAQLAPLSHLGDFGLGVLLPLLLYGLSRFLATDRVASEETVTLVLLALASIIIHSRETIQLLLCMSLIGVAAVVSARLSREQGLLLMRLVLVSVVVVVGAKLFLLEHHARVQHAVVYDTAQKVEILRSLLSNLQQPWGGLFADAPPLSDGLMLRDLFALGLLLAPATVLFWPQRWALFLGATIVGYVLVLRIPLIAYYYCRFTYSEIFMTPVRNVAFQIVLLVAVATYLLWSQGLRLWSEAGGGEGRGRRMLVAVAVLFTSLLTFGLAPPLLSRWALEHKNAFYLLFAGLLVVAFLARRSSLRHWRDWDIFGALPVTSLGSQALMAVLAISGLLLLSTPPSLRFQYQNTGTRPSPQDEQTWYETSALQGQLPYPVLQAVRQDVPRRSTVLCSYDSNLLLPMMDDYYVIHSGFHLSIDLLEFVDATREVRGEPPLGTERFEEFSERRDYSVRCLKDFPPVFSPEYTDDQDLRFLEKTRMTHLVFDGTKYPHLVTLVERNPSRLHTVRKLTVSSPAPPHDWYIVSVSRPMARRGLERGKHGAAEKEERLPEQWTVPPEVHRQDSPAAQSS